MSAYDSTPQSFDPTDDDNDNVIPFRPRALPPRAVMHVHDPSGIDMTRLPVDIRGQVTFRRLVMGLASVGLTVRVDVRAGRVVITDDEWER